jgi:hypothetical protein
VGFENNALWQERDISHSSAERVVLPDATILAFYMLRTTKRVLGGLQVHKDRMRDNLNVGGGIVFSGRVLLALVEAGLSRDDAYAVVQGAAMQAWEGEGGFRELLEDREEVREHLDGKLDALFDPAHALRNTGVVFERVEGLKGRLGRCLRPFSTRARQAGLLHRRRGRPAAPLQGRRHGLQRPETRLVEGQRKDQRHHERRHVRLSRRERRPEPLHRAGRRDDHKDQKLTMLPVEVVVRNVAAGSLSRLLGFEEGFRLKAPIVELCYKNDALGDPLLNWHHFRELGVSDEELGFCEGLGLKVNGILAPFFDERGVTLVDFKIEVGRDGGGRLMLADEISPTPAASGTRRPARGWTRTASAATSAGWRSLRGDVTPGYGGGIR